MILLFLAAAAAQPQAATPRAFLEHTFANYRNPAARLHLKAMKKGDEAFFYHSGEERQIVGIMRVTREGQPDPKDANWVSVAVEPVRPFGPVTLRQIKAEPKLAKMELIRQSRLSVAPVRDDEWTTILKMGAGK